MTPDGASAPATDPQSVANAQPGLATQVTLNRWGNAWLFIALGIGYVVLFFPTLLGLHERWIKFDEAYAHGYLVVAMVAYFTWLQRDRLRRAPQRSELLWLPVLAAMSLAWGLAQTVDVQLASALTLPLLALGAVHALGGRQISHIAAFPLLLLYLSVPLWEDVFGWILRTTTAHASSQWLEQFAHFPVRIDGYAISIPEGTFFVADSCSGLSFFLTGITIALAYGYLNFNSNRKRVLYLLICTALSVVSNWVRVTALVYIGHYSNMQSSLITEGHLLFGWYIFMGVMIVMLFIGYRMSDPLPPLEPLESLGSGGGSVQITPPRTHAAQLRALVLTLSALAVGPALLFAFRHLTVPSEPAPAIPAGFVAVAPADMFWLPDYHNFTTLITAAAQGEPALQLTLVHYPSQTQEKELVSDLNRIAKEHEWEIRSESTISTHNIDPLPHALTESNLTSPTGQQLLVWHWNNLGRYPAVGRTAGKLAQLRARLLDGRADATLVAFAMPCAHNCDDARSRLTQLMPRLMPLVDAQFQLSHGQ